MGMGAGVRRVTVVVTVVVKTARSATFEGFRGVYG
jgi:hypothetical protein